MYDAGKIINPTLFEGQIEGSIHMGLGYALTEDFVQEGGFPKSTRLRKCGILRAKETLHLARPNRRPDRWAERDLEHRHRRNHEHEQSSGGSQT